MSVNTTAFRSPNKVYQFYHQVVVRPQGKYIAYRLTVPPSIATQPQFSGASFIVQESGNAIMFVVSNTIQSSKVENFESINTQERTEKVKPHKTLQVKAWWESE